MSILPRENFVKSSVNFDLKKNKSESLTYFLRRCLGQGTGCPKCLEMRISIAFDTALFKFFHLKIFKYAAELTGQLLHNWTQCRTQRFLSKLKTVSKFELWLIHINIGEVNFRPRLLSYTQYPFIRNGDKVPLVGFLKNSPISDSQRFLIIQVWLVTVS